MKPISSYASVPVDHLLPAEVRLKELGQLDHSGCRLGVNLWDGVSLMCVDRSACFRFR